MFTPRPIQSLPDNFHQFVDEISRGMSEVYGPAAGAEYCAQAGERLSATLMHPMVQCLAAHDGSCAAGLLISVTHDTTASIAFLHVLRHYAKRGIEIALIEEAVRIHRDAGVEGIICENLSMFDSDEDAAFVRLGFGSVERLLMGATLDSPSIVPSGRGVSRPMTLDDIPAAARTIAAAYARHSDRRLHAEVRDEPGAADFLHTVFEGGFGESSSGRIRIIDGDDGKAALGVIAGCRVAPDVGFILQVAVHPKHQGRGLGAALVCEVSQAFRDQGFSRIALGVSVDNPAQNLYERLGFRTWHRVKAHVWSRPALPDFARSRV